MSQEQATHTQNRKKTAEEIQEWLIDRSFDEYMLNSSEAIHLTGQLEEWLGYEIEPTLFYKYSTIKKISLHLD